MTWPTNEHPVDKALDQSNTFLQRMKARDLSVMVGEHDLDHDEGGEIRLPVAEIRVHPWYDSHTFDNDIGK